MSLSLIRIFRWVSTLEAISFLLLLGIAMPLKYIWGKPEAVSIIGMAHGVLFVLYLLLAYYVGEKQGWCTRTLLIVMACAILPFGPFYAERKYL
ncbi:DUF3817 domain-containing protein [Gilvibacter sp.]|jgi:integral membrane protein|uniref:DUF3817 domain-containing protein n=1 Tax=Gilvibacter sp. TaxID=2729997 RepID=UPI0035BE9AC7